MRDSTVRVHFVYRCGMRDTKFYPISCIFRTAATGIHIEGIDKSTEVCDKTGQEIFEGDYVHAHGDILEVVFRDGCFYATNDEHDYPFHMNRGSIERHWTVVGNVYERSDLMEEQNETTRKAA